MLPTKPRHARHSVISWRARSPVMGTPLPLDPKRSVLW
jgi:hypothetical protein